MTSRREERAQAFAEMGRARVARVEHLLQSGEAVLDHGLARIDYVVPRVRLPAPNDEGFLLVTDRRLIFTSDRMGASESWPFEFVTGWKYKGGARLLPIVRHFARLRIDLGSRFSVRLSGSQGALASAEAALREGTKHDWSHLETTAFYFERGETFHGGFGLLPGLLRCRRCHTDIWLPRQFCAGCGRKIDWGESQPEAVAYNEARKELDKRLDRPASGGS